MSIPQFVIFVGPPYSGKTMYYLQHYATTHERVSASDLLRKDASVGLRGVVRTLADILKQGKNVVLDDENWSRETRVSYLKGVQKKVPGCKFICITFYPVYGAEQCFWSREWASAQKQFYDSCQSSVGINYIETDSRIEGWFRESSPSKVIDSYVNSCGPDFPIESEGFSIQDVKTRISCINDKQFVFPGLFLQWEAIVKLNNGSYCVPDAVVDAVKKWTKHNSCGRVVVVGDGKHQVSMLGHLASEDSTRQMLRPLLCLASQISSPLFFMIATRSYKCGGHFLPPKPGMLAWLQYVLDINLYHQSSLYVANSSSHQLAAEAAGLNTLKANDAFLNPNSLIAVHCGGKSICRMLSDVSLIQLGGVFMSSDSNQLIETSQLVQLTSDSEVRMTVSQTELCNDDQSTFGYLVKNSQSLHQFVTSSKAMLGPFYSKHEELSHAQNIIKESTCVPLISSDGESEEDIMQTPVHYDLGTERIRIALDDIQQLAGNKCYERGVGYCNNVKQLSSNPEMGGLFVTCQCKGTVSEPYYVSALVTHRGTIGDHCCTCPMGDMGDCCKHLVAMLLVFKNSLEVKASGLKTESSTTKKISPCSAGYTSAGNESLSSVCLQSNVSAVGCSPAAAKTVGPTTANQRTKPIDENQAAIAASQQWDRSLPHWISQTGEHCRSVSRTKNEISRRKKDDESPLKRRKSCEIIYQMSEEELILTAKELLEKSGCDHGKKWSSDCSSFWPQNCGLKESPSFLGDEQRPVNCKMDLFHSDGMQLSLVGKQSISRSKILVEATPSVPADEECQPCRKEFKSVTFQETARTRVAETLVPDTVVPSAASHNHYTTTSSISVVPETIDSNNSSDNKEFGKGESASLIDIDVFLFGN